MVKKKLWKTFSEILPPDEEQQSLGMRLFNKWETHRVLLLTRKEILETETEVIIDFFRRLETLHSPVSPVQRKKDSRWIAGLDMLKIDWEETQEGAFDFITASFAAACSRNQSIWLAPFTARDSSGSRAIISHTLINPGLENGPLCDAGITGSLQLEALSSAVHYMGKTLGAELDYFVYRFSAPVIRRPDMFRWIFLGNHPGQSDGHDLKGNAIFSKENQRKYHEAVNDLVNSGLQHGLSHEELVENLKKAGYWPVSAARDEGGIVPESYEIDSETGEPLFDEAVSDVVPFCFQFKGDGEINRNAVDYYKNIYIRWRDHYSFDFLVLSGLNFRHEDSGAYVESPGADVLAIAAETSRKNGKKRTGIVLSGDCSFSDFLEQEADLLHRKPLRNSLSCLDRSHLNREINLCESIAELNKDRKKRRYPLRPYLKTPVNPIDEIKQLRDFFLARFLFTGTARTPLLNTPRNIIDNKENEFPGYSETLRIMDEIYLRNLNYLDNASLCEYKIYETYGWWLLSNRKAYFLAVVSLDNESDSPANPDPVKIPAVNGAYRERTVLEYDFRTIEGNLMLSGGSLLDPGPLAYRHFKLFSIL